ncbi:protein Niban 1a isoform X1 [Tachysurus ichikawai]
MDSFTKRTTIVNRVACWAQTALRHFALIYKKQYSLAFLSHVHDELVQRKQEHTRLLKQRDPPQEAEVVYQEPVLYFCDNRKWKERFVVVRANYSLECHESYETFIKGIPPLYKLPATGGTILTTEEKYMEVVDRCFPDTDNVKEEFAPPVVGMPGQFPVYLRLPYQRDYYFCFLQEAKQAMFISVLSDCIRHQNQDFLKKKTYEVQAFVKAIQLYRQDKGYYEEWDMLIGNDVQMLTNLTIEELMPFLEKDMLTRLKAKKMDKKRMWFATIEAAYNLVQEILMEGMAALNDECRETTKQQSALMRSDMDQIMSSRAFLENKLRATVAELATEYCKENIEPRLPAVLEEMMGPISLGFEEARQVSERLMEYLCKNYQAGLTREELQQALVEISKPDLKSCYEKVSGLRDQIHEFSYPNCRGLEHSTQIDIQQLVDSVSYTFALLLNKSLEDNTNLLDAMTKAKQRVLKQYDYDSSTQRKKIFQEALLSITLPSVKAFLAPTFKKELPNFEQYIFDDYVNFINVENVYEDILQQILEQDIGNVVKEAASMKKYNLFMESRYRFSVSSRYFSMPDSPDYNSSPTTELSSLPSSPLLSHGLMESPCTGEDPGVAEKEVEQEEVQAHTQPELIKVPAGEDPGMSVKTVEQEVIIEAHEQTELIKVPAGEDLGMSEKTVEQEVILAQQVEIQAQAQSEPIKVETSVKAEKDHKVEDYRMLEVPVTAESEIRVTPDTLIEHTVVGEDMLVATQNLEEKMFTGASNVVAINPETLLDPASYSSIEPALKPAGLPLLQSSPPVQDNPPVGASPTPIQASPTPIQSSPTPIQASPTPIQASPIQASPTPIQASPTPVQASPTPVQASPTPVQASPSLVQASPSLVQASPSLGSPSPLVQGSPSPLVQASPTPNQAIPPPDQAFPPPDQAIPPPDQAIPPPDQAIPPPVQASPPPVQASPTLNQVSPTPIQVSPPLVQASPPPVQANPPPVQSCPPAQASPPPVQASPPPVQSCPPQVQSCPPQVQSCPPPVQACPPVQSCPPVQASPPPVQASPLPVPTCPLVQASSQIRTSPPPDGSSPSPVQASHSPVQASPLYQASPPVKPTPTPAQASPLAQVSPPAQICPPDQAGPPVVQASPLVQASPPEGDTRPMDQVLQSESVKCISAESETESAASISSSVETAPDVPGSSGVQLVKAQTSNNSEDINVSVDDLTSLRPPSYEVRVSNVTEFSDDSSWTTEEEEDSIEEDELTMDTTADKPKPEVCITVKCETMSDVSASVTDNSAETEAARPLDCIKEIRELVVEVIEVEEIAQHYPDKGEVHLNTQ